MEPLVMKFGGTSVGSLERIRAVAERALQAQAEGVFPVLVVSAMSGETDRLLGLARSLGGAPDPAEVDVLAATGEQAAAALVALAIQRLGGKARSFLGGQLALRTDGPHGDARVKALDPRPLRRAIGRGEIPVIAGFQGVSAKGRVTTLGRGGSDTTAVAVAAALGARVCEIYTDVDGVYSGDPSQVPEARRLTAVGYDAMEILAKRGAKVLHARSVTLARRHGIELEVLSSFASTVKRGTRVGPARIADGNPGLAVACDKQFAHLLVDGVMVELRQSEVESFRRAVACKSAAAQPELAQVSLVGDAADSVLAAEVMAHLAREKLPVRRITAESGAITCWVDAHAALAVMRALHDRFVLPHS